MYFLGAPQQQQLTQAVFSQDHNNAGRVLIFVETKKGCDALTRSLRHEGWPALAIHGDKNQVHANTFQPQDGSFEQQGSDILTQQTVFRTITLTACLAIQCGAENIVYMYT